MQESGRHLLSNTMMRCGLVRDPQRSSHAWLAALQIDTKAGVSGNAGRTAQFAAKYLLRRVARQQRPALRVFIDN
jgi:hypothetical protein